MNNTHTRTLANVYLARGEFNISQFRLRQSLTLERYGITIEFGILEHNHFIRFKKNGEILSEVCSSSQPVHHVDRIISSEKIGSQFKSSGHTFDTTEYNFEADIVGSEVGTQRLITLQNKTNAEHVYKLTHQFKREGDREGDIVELYLNVHNGITLETVRISGEEPSMLFTTSGLTFV